MHKIHQIGLLEFVHFVTNMQQWCSFSTLRECQSWNLIGVFVFYSCLCILGRVETLVCLVNEYLGFCHLRHLLRGACECWSRALPLSQMVKVLVFRLKIISHNGFIDKKTTGTQLHGHHCKPCHESYNWKIRILKVPFSPVLQRIEEYALLIMTIVFKKQIKSGGVSFDLGFCFVLFYAGSY